MKKFFYELKQQRASATVEAVVAFTGFLFTIFTILGVVNVCRAQMLVSNAVDTAAKQLSQYSYFYDITGLDQMSTTLGEKAGSGKDKINAVIGSVDNLYQSIGNVGNSTVNQATNLQNAFEGGTLSANDFSTAITNIDTSVTNVSSAINSVSSSIDGIIDNPIVYLKSIVSVIAGEGMDLAKNVIAGVLGKAFTVSQFGNSSKEASEFLKSIGIPGGVDDLDFSLSTMFNSDDGASIKLVCCYHVQMMQLFDLEDLDAGFCKVAYVHGWLGGDNSEATSGKVKEKIKTETTTAAPTRTVQSGNEESKAEEDTTSKQEEQTTAAKVDTNGSYWHLGVDAHYYDNTAAAFDNLLVTSKGVNREETVVNGLNYGRDKHNKAYGMDFCVDADEVHSNFIYMSSMEQIKLMEDMYVESGGKEGYKPGSTTSYTYVIYVPENIPNDKLEAIEKASEELHTEYSATAKEKYGLDIPVSVEIIKAGGNYDYGSEG